MNKKVNMSNITSKLNYVYKDECEKNIAAIVIYNKDGEFFFDPEYKNEMTNLEVEALLLRGALVDKEGKYYRPSSFNENDVSFSNAIINPEDIEVDLSGYATKEEMTTQVNQGKADMEAIVAEVDALSEQLEQIENNIIVITTSMSISDINAKLAKGGTFLFKGGTYLLDNGESITVASNSRLIFEPNAIIKYNYNHSTIYTILNINGCENVIIEDAHLIGCRDTHVGTDGEWGYGIEVTASRNIKLIRPRIEKTWGDGIYIGYKWVETNPLYRTSNIEILNSTIYKCSRNGISICSGDNILIDTAYIEGVDRTAPKAGVDIEPECGTEDLIHMSNITINNLTTKDNSAGITIIMNAGETGCTGCKISINNHVNYGSAAISMGNDGGYEYEFSVNGGIYYDTPYVAINVINTVSASRIIFSDIKIIGKTKDSAGGDYTMHSAILLFIDKDGDFGNVSFRNILIDTKGYAYNFSNPFAVAKSGANTVTSRVQNINIENFRTTESQGTMCLQCADLDTFEANNLYIPVTSNYYLRDLGIDYYTDFTYDNLTDWCTVNITHLLPDGVYTIRVLKNNSYSVTIIPGEGLSFANGATGYILREGEFRFIKTGTNITALGTAYDGGFTGLE